MVAYLPRASLDEMLYSLLARAAAHRGATSAAAVMREFFGRRHVVSSFDLPGGIAALASRLEGGADWGVGEIIDRLTLFPFYTAFASSSLRREGRVGMAGGMAGVHTRLGVTTFRIPPLRTLRFCSECLAAWDAAGTEWYWRRSHQMSGIPVCPDHGRALQFSRVSLDAGDRHGFVPATPETCPSDAATVIPAVDASTSEKLQALARSAQTLLDAPPPPADPDEHVERYRRRLDEVGLMRSARKVDQVSLETGFLSFWAGVLPLLSRVVTGGTPTGGWLMAMVRSPRRSAHPVCHLLLSGFLDTRTAVDRPFGSGPWICRNPLAEHHGSTVITSVGIRRDGAMRYGDFHCDCGYHYTRSLSQTGQVSPARYRAFGPTLKPVLVEMASAGFSLGAAARRVALEPKTLMREALLLGVEVPWSTETRPSIQPVRSRRTMPVSRTSRPRPVRRSRDWEAMDQELEAAAEEVIGEILLARPVARVTWTEVERRIAAIGWISKRRRKLPRTSEAIRKREEPLLDFRWRRLVDVLQRTHDNPGRTPSDVLREAGLPTAWLPKVRAVMFKTDS